MALLNICYMPIPLLKYIICIILLYVIILFRSIDQNIIIIEKNSLSLTDPNKKGEKTWGGATGESTRIRQKAEGGVLWQEPLLCFQREGMVEMR